MDGFDRSKDKRDSFTADELLDEAELEAKQFNLLRPNLVAERTRSTAGVRTASKKSR